MPLTNSGIHACTTSLYLMFNIHFLFENPFLDADQLPRRLLPNRSWCLPNAPRVSLLLSCRTQRTDILRCPRMNLSTSLPLNVRPSLFTNTTTHQLCSSGKLQMVHCHQDLMGRHRCMLTHRLLRHCLLFLAVYSDPPNSIRETALPKLLRPT